MIWNSCSCHQQLSWLISSWLVWLGTTYVIFQSRIFLQVKGDVISNYARKISLLQAHLIYVIINLALCTLLLLPFFFYIVSLLHVSLCWFLALWLRAGVLSLPNPHSVSFQWLESFTCVWALLFATETFSFWPITTLGFFRFLLGTFK